MEKEFVPYELALRLKALGFDEPCFGFHSKIHGLMMVKTSGSSSLYKDAGECLAPTYSQAFRWFREKYNIEAKPMTVYHGSDKYYHLSWITPIPSLGHSFTMTNEYNRINTYEEAELACLEKLLEICSSK